MSSKRSTRTQVTDLVTIRKRGKIWHAQFTFAGKQQGKSLGTPYVEQAKQKALDIDYGLRKGLYMASEDIEVGALLEKYMAHLKAENRRPSTINRYRPVFERFAQFCSERGVRKASQADMLLLENFRGWRSEEGAAEGTVYRETLWIKQVWKYAEVRRLVPVNRLKEVCPKKPADGDQPVFTEGEVERIITNAEERDRGILTVLAFTGMRRGELQWLTWDDVDLEHGWLHVRAKDGWKPKNGKNRKMPLHERAKAVLKKLPKSHRWVFAARTTPSTPKGGRQIHLDHLRERLLKNLEALGIERGGLHSFRRFFITHCANKSVAPTVLMKWVGHSDLRMIMRYYRLHDDESQQAMEALNSGTNPPGFKTVLRQTGVPEKQPRPQPPVFRVVTGAAS